MVECCSNHGGVMVVVFWVKRGKKGRKGEFDPGFDPLISFDQIYYWVVIGLGV